MKKLFVFFILILFSLPAFVTAQNKLQNYKKFDYISVENEQMETFLTFSKNELKSAFQKLIDSGAIKSWELYKQQYPAGEKAGYNFLSVITAGDLDSLNAVFSNAENSGFIPDNLEKSKADYKNFSELIKSELWNVENSILKEGRQTIPSKYITIDYMDVAPGKSPDYLMLEDEIAKPIHKERIGQGSMAGWQVYSLILPGGTEYGYNYSTVNSFDKVSDVEFGFTNEVINQTMGENADISELFNTIYETRDLVKIELWKLLITVD